MSFIAKGDKVVIILGSENKRDTLRNPFAIETRKQMLISSLSQEYKNKIEVYELPDWSKEDRIEDSEIWGRYFYYNVVSRIRQKSFDLYYSDGKEILDSWFQNTEVRKYINYRLFERSSMFDGLSATKIRNAIENNNLDYIKKHCPKAVVDKFDYLRNYYLSVLDDPKDDYEI